MFIWILMLSSSPSLSRAVEIECEHLMRARARFVAERDLRRVVAELPFTLVQAFEITPAARARLNLGRDLAARPERAQTLVASLHRTADHPWTLCLRRWDLDAVFECPRQRFPDDHPLLWQMVRVEAHAEDLAARTPLPRTTAPLRDHHVGFTTDPDANGVRVYVRAHDDREAQTVYLELGLDVPADRLDRYLTPAEIKRGHGHLVQTPVAQYRRVPAFVFARAK